MESPDCSPVVARRHRSRPFLAADGVPRGVKSLKKRDPEARRCRGRTEWVPPGQALEREVDLQRRPKAVTGADPAFPIRKFRIRSTRKGGPVSDKQNLQRTQTGLNVSAGD